MPGVVSDVARAKVRAYTESNMDGLVTIVRGRRGALDPATGRVAGMAVDSIVYGSGTGPGGTEPEGPLDVDADTGGKARVRTVHSQGAVSNGAGEIDIRQVTVSIPWYAPMPRREDIVLIRSGGQDPDLNGKVARVGAVEGGGLFGDARRMSCTLWGRSEYWTATGGQP